MHGEIILRRVLAKAGRYKKAGFLHEYMKRLPGGRRPAQVTFLCNSERMSSLSPDQGSKYAGVLMNGEITGGQSLGRKKSGESNDGTCGPKSWIEV